MADDTIRKLLLRIGISPDWKNAVADIKNQLSQVNDKAKTEAEAMKRVQKEQVDLTKAHIAEEKKKTAEQRIQQELGKTKIVQAKQEQEAQKTILGQKKIQTAEEQKQNVLKQGAVKLEQEKLRLAQQQYKLLQAQTKEHERQIKAAAGGGGRGGEGGGFGASLLGALGGSPLGAIAGGAAVGGIISEGVIKLLDTAKEKLHALGEAILEATGPTAQLREQFEKLTRRAGEAPDEYLDKLRHATRGLVDDTQLYRIANGFMQSGIKVSTDQMVRLTKATTDLARSQGKDATVAANALERALRTGYTRQLAMVTGLTKQELQLKGVSQATDAVTRQTLQFNQVLAAEEARLKAIGTPATTLPELLKQWQNVQKNFIDDIAIAITKSQGYKDAIQEISKVLWELEPILSRIVKAFTSLTDAFILAGPTVKVIVESFKAFYRIDEAITKVLQSITRFDTSFTTIFSQGKASKFRQFASEMALGMLTLAEYISQASIKIAAFGDIASNVLNRNFKAAREAYNQMQKDLDASKDEYLHSALSIAKYGLGINEPEAKAGAQTSSDSNAIVREKQIQQLQLQIQKETNKLKYDILEQGLKAETEAVKRSYAQGIMNLEQKVAREKIIEQESFAYHLAQLRADHEAEVAQINKTAKATSEPAALTKVKVEKADVAFQAKSVELTTGHNQKIGNLDDELTNDKVAAARERAAAETKIAKEGVDERIALLDHEFKAGREAVESYIAEKRDLINQGYLVEDAGLKKQLGTYEQNSKEYGKIDAQRAELKQKTEKELAVFDASQDDLRLQYMEKQYSIQKQTQELELKRAESTFRPGGGSPTQIQENLINLTAEYIKQLEVARSHEEAGKEKWLQISEQIEKADTDLTNMALKLNLMKNIGIPIGGIAGGLAGISGLFRGNVAGGITHVLQTEAEVAPQIGKFGAAIQASGPGGTGGNFQQYIGQLAASFKALFDSSQNLGDRFKKFGDNIGGIISGIQGLIKGVTSGRTGGEGALSGGMAGAQFGNEIGGPLGGIIGLGVGASMGAIFGAKNKQLQQDIHKIQAQLQSIVSDLQSGTISLTQAIQDLRAERQQAIDILSHGSDAKKGGKGGKKGLSPSQAQAVIQQIDQQIQQLVNEQSMLLQQLHSSIMELAQPIAFQQYVQSLDTIIQKYQQFASAAQGNAQEVAAANEFLNESLQNYVTTLSQQLNQAQQQAIQDALTLINLEYQRQQIINQEAQQEYDILSQGVLTRQRTTAMTKGQEIGQLRYQRDMQLEQINEQISLQQYKVDSERKIFGLAQTRIGLETQLLEAQQEQANYQIQQVQALAQVVADLSSGMAGGQLMNQIQQLMAGGAMPTGPGILYTLLQELGLAGNVPPGATQGQYGTQNWLAAIPAQYASAAQYVASLDPNFVTEIMNAQYSQAAQDAQQYKSQGNVEGYDMSGLISWLSGQGGGGGGGQQPPQQPPGSQLPGGAAGGDFSGPGLIRVGEKGTEVLALGQNQKGTIIPNPLISALNGMFGLTSPGGNNANRGALNVHSQLLDMTSKRASIEMTVISARQSQIAMEAQLIEMLNDHLDQLSQFASSSSSLEGQFQKIYEMRGRYGSGNFRREYL